MGGGGHRGPVPARSRIHRDRAEVADRARSAAVGSAVMNDRSDANCVGEANLRFARALVGELHLAGVAAAFVCPGSRSTPLALAIAERDGTAAQRPRGRAQRGLPGARIREGLRPAGRAALHVGYGRREFPARRRRGRSVTGSAGRTDCGPAARAAGLGCRADDGAAHAVRGLHTLERRSALSVGAQRCERLCMCARSPCGTRGDGPGAGAGASQPAVP